MKARYKSIVDALAFKIRSGEIITGTRLPTHRELSAHEHISLVTATRVYRELEAMGLVSGETGRGTFVREIALPSGHGIDQISVASDVVDLNFNYPSLPEQGDMLRDALKKVAAGGDIESHLRYQPHAGRLSEREVIADHLSFRGFKPTADHVLIVNGAQHGLTVAVMGLLRPGDVVAVDALTYPGFKALAELYHLEIIAIPQLSNGPDLTALNQLCQKRRVRAVYTMPTLHNPLGWVMTSSQRKQLAQIARNYDLLIIEDAAYSYLVTNPPAPLAFYAPVHFRPMLERAVRATTWNTPSVMTSLICSWILDGTVSRLEMLKRRDARQRQAILRDILGETSCISHPSSYFAWLPLREESRADRIAKILMDSGISVSTAEPFSTSLATPQAIRIALGSVSADQLRAALLVVRDAVEFEQSR